MPHITDGRRAFSLLEMAMVVTIIGLLAGAIIVGQNYVYRAQLTTMVNDAKYYRDALNRFEDKYHSLPGDMPNASAIWQYAGNGDGSGFISYPTNQREFFLVFQHLANAGFIEGAYTGVSVAGVQGAVPGKNVPAAAIENVGYWFWDLNNDYLSGSTAFFDGYYVHPLVVGMIKSGDMPFNPFLTPKEAYQIDDKYDDGRPGTGTIRTQHAGSSPECVAGTNPASATYLGTNLVRCWLIFLQP